MSALCREHDDEGVVWLTLDVPGEKVNTLARVLVADMAAALTAIEEDEQARVVVLMSGKPDSYIAGADIKEFVQVKSVLEAEMLSRAAQGLLDRLAAFRLPVVTAIHGPCLGGGLELALACRYRLASDHAKTVLAAPEVMLGLIPGAGGTQRLPRLIGLVPALDMILTGRTVRSARALRLGLVDEVVPPGALRAAAHKAALGLAAGTLKLRRRGARPWHALGRPVVLRKARTTTLEKTGGHYPAPERALDVIALGLSRGKEEGLKAEARAFGELTVGEVSRALVSIFFATQDIKKDVGVPEGTRPRDVRKLGVLGAGLMGAGIAAAAAHAGVPVRLKDASTEALGRGLRSARAVFESRRKRRRLNRRELEQRMDRISPTLDMTGFERADLVIEAVFEDLELKRRVLAEAEAVVDDECVVASNTSSLPIAEIARDARRPNRVLGMHFFSPVEKMPLLEVVVTPETDAWATTSAAAFGRRLGKHVIVVRDGPGFFTTRTLAPYLNEAARLLEEGADVEHVDRTMKTFGFPVGPITLLDEVGLDVGAKVARVMHKHLGERMAPPVSMERVVEDGRLGRKSRRGFYTYGGRRKRVDTSVYKLLPNGPERRSFETRQIEERLVFAFLNESVHCLQDGILRTPRDGDVGTVFGLGFPPFLGGVFRYLDQLGARFVVETLERLEASHGARFRPASLLTDMARSGKSFHV